MSFTSTTVPDLDSQGSRKNMVYYDDKQIMVQDCQMSNTIGRYSQSLTSLAFGSTSQVVLPNNDCCYEVFLHVKLPAIIANQTLPRGWIYSAIREVSFTFGQANVSQLRLSGKSLLQLAMASCPTKEKRSELLFLGGEAKRSAGGEDPEATMIIPLPWSNNDHVKSKPFDLSLLSNPVQIQITLNDASSIYGGTAAAPSSLASGQVFTRLGTFSDMANSIKNDLMGDSRRIYNYPFYYKMSPSPKYNLTLDGTTVNRVELLEFINSDLQSIILSVHPTDLQRATGTNAPLPNASCELLDLEVIFAGQTIYRAPGNSARLIDQIFDEGASGAEDALLTQTSPWDSAASTNYTYIIPFSAMKSINFHYSYDNVPRFASQTMQLAFRARQLLGTPAGGAPTAIGGTVGELHCTYVYSAVASIQSGTANIRFG